MQEQRQPLATPHGATEFKAGGKKSGRSRVNGGSKSASEFRSQEQRVREREKQSGWPHLSPLIYDAEGAAR